MAWEEANKLRSRPNLGKSAKAGAMRKAQLLCQKASISRQLFHLQEGLLAQRRRPVAQNVADAQFVIRSPAPTPKNLCGTTSSAPAPRKNYSPVSCCTFRNGSSRKRQLLAGWRLQVKERNIFAAAAATRALSSF